MAAHVQLFFYCHRKHRIRKKMWLRSLFCGCLEKAEDDFNEADVDVEEGDE